MKNFFLLSIFFILLVSSCSREPLGAKIISNKNYQTFYGDPMPDCICRFWYREYEFGESNEFQDSCWKYNIGDTIIGSAKNY